MDYALIRKLRLGGVTDAISLCAAGTATLMSNPYFGTTPWYVPTAIAAMAGLHLGARFTKPFIDRHGVLGKHALGSSDVPVDMRPGDRYNGLLLGYTVDGGKPVIIEDDFLSRHGFILGASGVGKTVLGESMMLQQIMRGGGLIFMDGKLAYKNLQNLYGFCRWAGRLRDLFVLNPGDPRYSNTYNPILQGDPDEVAARILSLIPSTDHDPSTDYYKQAANQGLTTLVAALQAAKLKYSFMDLTILLMSPRALAELERITPTGTARTQLQLFLEQFRVPDRQSGKLTIDLKKLKDTFGGIGGRMFVFGSGSFGKMMNTYNPELNLLDAITQNKIIYVMLPTMGKNIAASNFAKMLIGDLRTAIAHIQARPESEKPNPPYLVFLDEANSYVAESFQTMFEQSREARVVLIPAAQTLSGFDAVDETLTEMVIGNCWTKIYFKIGTQDSAERAAELIGTYRGALVAVAETNSESTSMNPMAVTPDYNAGNAGGTNYTEREEERHIVDPNVLKGLGIGEAIVTFGGSKVYHIKIPLFKPNSQVTPTDLGKVKLNHLIKSQAKGIRLFERADEFLSASEQRDLQNRSEGGVTPIAKTKKQAATKVYNSL
jgi:hypothetical protein